MGEATTLGRLVERGILLLGDGYRTKRSEHGSPGFRILRVADVENNRIRAGGGDFVREEFARFIGSKLSEPGDVLLTTKGTVGRVAIVGPEMEQVVYSPQLCYLRVRDESVVDRRFLAFWLKSEAFRKQAAHHANNTDMAPYISLGDLRSVRVDLPKVERQRAIAEVLGALDDKIAANDLIVTKIRDLLRARYELLRLSDEPDRTLADLVELNPAIPRSAAVEPPYLDMKNLPDSAMTVSGWSNRRAKGGARFENGDTLLARITPCLENGKVGFIDFLATGEVGFGSTEFIVMRARPGVPRVLPYFLASSGVFREYAIKHMTGTSGRQRLAAASVGMYPIRQPSSDSLDRFDQFSRPLMARLKCAVDETRLLAATRDELLPPLMSGRLRVKDAEKVVAEVV